MIVYQLQTPMGITAPLIEYASLSSIEAHWNSKGFKVIVLNEEKENV
jgi:hypothetical protein